MGKQHAHSAEALQQQLADVTRRYQALQRVVESISSELALEPLLTRICASAVDLLDAQDGAIGLVEDGPQGSVVRIAAVYNLSPLELGALAAPGVGLAGRVLLEQQPIYVERYGELEPATRTELHDHTVIGVPIWWSGRMIGFFGIGAEPPRCFEPHDAELLALFAHHAAVAIVNAQLFARTQHALSETQLLYSTSQRISTAMSVDEVVAAYLEHVAARGRYACTVVLYAFDPFGTRVAVIVRGFWSAATGLRLFEERIPYARDDLDPPLDEGQTITIPDVHSDPRCSPGLRQMQERDQRPALALIPLMARGLRIGLVVLSYAHIHHWPEAELQPYQVTAVQLATAIDHRRQQLLVVEQGQQVAVLEERRRLARELHDSVTQSLFSMSLLAQVVPDLWEIDQDEARAALGQIRDLTRGALAEMRALLFELRPAAMGGQELARAIQQHAGVFEQRTGIAVSVELSGALKLPAPIEQALFRIAQEALTNVARHAHARHVQLSLQGGMPLRLRIADDGRGFQPDRVGEGRFGLVSIRERAASIGAEVQIHSIPGRGTEIAIEWPRPTS